MYCTVSYKKANKSAMNNVCTSGCTITFQSKINRFFEKFSSLCKILLRSSIRENFSKNIDIDLGLCGNSETSHKLHFLEDFSSLCLYCTIGMYAAENNMLSHNLLGSWHAGKCFNLREIDCNIIISILAVSYRHLG